MPTALEDLENELATRTDRVLVVAGAGVACATDTNPCASWSGLLKDGVQRCRDRCHTLNADWATITELLVKQNSAAEFLQAASRIEQALRDVHDGEYAQWLADSVGALEPKDRRTIEAILSWGTRVATTNYDNLFEDVSGLRPVVWDEGQLALQVLRGDHSGILHVHGHHTHPDSVVFGARTYADICRDVHAQNLLRSILTRDTVIFVGCGAGVDDPNFGGLFEWSKDALRSCVHTHYHLVRESELEAVATQYRGLRVTPLVYGKTYAELGPFLEQLAERVRRKSDSAMPLDSLLIRQNDYETQRHDLDARTDLASLEYVVKSFELARSLWNAGGHRTAALHMTSVLTKKRTGLVVPDRVDYMLEAVEYLLEDGLDFHAMTLLEDIQEMIPQLQAAEVHARFRRLLAQCLAARANLKQLEQVIDAALPSASPQERARLQAERAEFHMLSGELTQADRDSSQEGCT